MWLWLTVIVLMVIVPISAIILALVLASLGWHFAEIEKGNTVFVVRGKTLHAIWPNVGGHRLSDEEDLNGTRWLIREDDPNKIRESFSKSMMPGTRWLQMWLWDKFGIRFVSLFFPKIRIHRFEVQRSRLKEATDVGPDSSLRDRIDTTGEPEVDSLLFVVPRPIYIEGVELAGDNAKINLLVLAIFKQVIPALPVFYFKGKWFPMLDSTIESAIINFCATHREEGKALTYQTWRQLNKGDGSPIEAALRKLNASAAYYDQLEQAGKHQLLKYLRDSFGDKPEPIETTTLVEKIPHGIVQRFGFGLFSLRVIAWEDHPETSALAEASRAKELQMKLAEGVRAKADGEADAIRRTGEADAERIGKMVRSVVEQMRNANVPGEAIGEAIAKIFQAEELRKVPNLQTLILGDSSRASVLIPPTNRS